MSEILDTIKKLLNLRVANGATEAEEAAALAAAQRLLLKHGLSMQDVELHGDAAPAGIVTEEEPLPYRRSPKWTQILAIVVAKGFGAELIICEGGHKTSSFKFVGTPVNAALARWLYVRLAADITQAVDKAVEHERREWGRVSRKFREQFVVGAAYRIGQRLETARKAAAEAEPGGTALVVRESELIEAYLESQQVTRGKTIEVEPGVGTLAGRKFGDRVSLDTNGLEHDPKRQSKKLMADS